MYGGNLHECYPSSLKGRATVWRFTEDWVAYRTCRRLKASGGSVRKSLMTAATLEILASV